MSAEDRNGFAMCFDDDDSENEDTVPIQDMDNESADQKHNPYNPFDVLAKFDIRPSRLSSSNSSQNGSARPVSSLTQKKFLAGEVAHNDEETVKPLYVSKISGDEVDFLQTEVDQDNVDAPHDLIEDGMLRGDGGEEHEDQTEICLGRGDSQYKKDDKPPKLKPFEPQVPFDWFDMLIGVVAISVFFVDIGTDIELATHYFKQKMWMYGGVTAGLIIGPSLVTCFLGLHWYIIDYRKEKQVVEKLKRQRRKAYITPKYVWFLRIFFTLLQFGPVVRSGGFVAFIGLLAVLITESFRALALISSWGSLAISLVSYHKSLRNSHEEKAKMSLISLPFYFIWRASEIGGRVLSIAMFASVFKLWVFGPLVFHWLFVSVWLMMQRTTFYKNKCLEKVFNVICGYVMVFCFLNLREGQTRFRFILFYFVVYTESFFMLAFWFRFTTDLGAWFHIWGFVVVLVLFVVHIVFQLLYYRFFHPTGNIKTCLPCDRYVIYSSICHEVQPQEQEEVVVVVGDGVSSEHYTMPELDSRSGGEGIINSNSLTCGDVSTGRKRVNQSSVSVL
ncbi:XK-related protein [Elysia marginata]|uniref:XK-related protein n=1 Tax=Elysia marginata TaxID=1093978 RepID=A0AAV4GAH6_9GAST|nr:XK-related protein [Elysia marginata]